MSSTQSVIPYFFFYGTIIILAGLLIFSKRIRKRENLTEKIFFRMVITGIAIWFLENIYVFMSIAGLTKGEGWVNVMPLAYALAEMLYAALTLQWLILVDSMVYKSPSHIKRRFKYAYIPILLGVVFAIFQYSCYYLEFFELETVLLLFDIVTALIALAQIAIVIQTYIVVHRYNKDRRVPLFLNLEVYVIPAVIGCILALLIHNDLPREFSYAVGIALTFIVASNRYRYIDDETGFYNRSFLELCEGQSGKRTFDASTAIVLKAEGHDAELVNIIKTGKPKNAEAIKLRDCVYMVTSGAQSEDAVKVFIKYIDMASSKSRQAFDVAPCIVSRQESETTGDFIKRAEKEADIK